MVVLWRRSACVYIQFSQQLKRQRHYWKNMDCQLLQPPQNVRGMIELKRETFKKCVEIPSLRVSALDANKILPLLKKQLLKMEKMRPVRECNRSNEQNDGMACEEMREILLHPLAVNSWDSLPTHELAKLQVNRKQFEFCKFELGYDNWRADEIFKSVLPTDDEGLTSYSRIGHIVHLNLRDHLLPYKKLIGQVLLDKVAGCRTVVNKAATIDNTYRNFQLELICGEPVYKVETKENGIVFEFDFSRVYWNPRLATEHERITKLLQAKDILYDVFAGVGPFSVPAARKGCCVLANDLNPESYKWLVHNGKRNKCLANMQTFNKDGRAFLLENVREDLLKRWRAQAAEASSAVNYNMHIAMNLPAMAVEFLDVFRGLFAQQAMHDETIKNLLQENARNITYPTVHVYAFAKGEDTKTLVRELIEKHLGLPLSDDLLVGIHFVRNVAPNKDMYRVSFRLTREILFEPFAMNEAASSVCLEKMARKRSAVEEGLAAVGDDAAIANKMKCN